jgi:hypothetical protein
LVLKIKFSLLKKAFMRHTRFFPGGLIPMNFLLLVQPIISLSPLNVNNLILILLDNKIHESLSLTSSYSHKNP